MTQLFSERGAPHSVRHRSRTPVLVLGHARSGTSAFSALLRKYLHVAIGTESQFIVRFQRALSRYGELANDGNIYRLVQDICRERWFERSRKFGFEATPEGILADVKERSYRGVLHAIFGQFAQCLGMQRWGDKTPAYVHSLPVLHALFPDAKYIHVIRDGRDVALSGFGTSFGQKNVYCAAVDWVAVLSQVTEFAVRVGPAQLLEVRYEDFVARPTEVFGRLIEFLKIDDADGSTLSFIDDRIREDLKPGNCQKWRKKLTPAQIQRFDNVASTHLTRYGYETTVTDAQQPLTLVDAYWKLDNRARKLCRGDYWKDNFYKLNLKLRGVS